MTLEKYRFKPLSSAQHNVADIKKEIEKYENEKGEIQI